jgi:hypothetical protein
MGPQDGAGERQLTRPRFDRFGWLYATVRFPPGSGRNRSLVSLAVGSKPKITASIRREKPIRFFAYSRQLVPKPHRAEADEPTDPEPIGIACHSSV